MQEEQNIKRLDKHDNPGAFYDYESWDDMMAAGGARLQMISAPESFDCDYSSSTSTSHTSSTSTTTTTTTTNTTEQLRRSGTEKDPIEL